MENSCPPSNQVDKCSYDPGTTPLVMRAYYPSNQNYTTCKLHPIIIFHAGGYLECGDYTNPGVREIARDLAVRGFVVYDVNYRVGTIADFRSPVGGVPSYITYTACQQWLSIYRALQDARGAIRSIIKMQKNGINSLLYQIDTTSIFLAGVSAGSVLALSSEFYRSQTKINQIFTGVSNAFGASFTPPGQLSQIDPKGVYYADPPLNADDDYFSKVKGILDCWGSLLTPATQQYYVDPYAYFSGQGYALPPVIAFHGRMDSTFNYVRQGGYFSTTDNIYGYGTLFKTESRCLPNAPYSLNPNNDDNPDFITIGSQTIYQMLKAKGIFTEFYLDCQMAHGLDADCTPSPGRCYFSDFGTNATTASQTYYYIAGRAATFFQAILTGTSATLITSGHTSMFTECKNTRIKCNTADAGGCSDSDGPCPVN